MSAVAAPLTILFPVLREDPDLLVINKPADTIDAPAQHH
jgi:23S rRNA-/tRNA-specific pseudouridylate synthase